MIDGIYHVTFSSNSNDMGQGLAVFKGDSINGGDEGYLYIGTKAGQGTQFTSRLTIKQWDPRARSIFGPIKEFVLELSGTSALDNSFIAHGTVAGQPQAKITIRGRRLADAA